MKTGFRGTFVIPWSQTDVDGLETAPLEAIEVGAAWSWRGEAVQVDGPGDILRLEQADGEANLRKRAARKVRRLVGAAVQNLSDPDAAHIDDTAMDSSFVVTNGAQSYTITVIETGAGCPPLLMFLNELPPRNTDLWVVHLSLNALTRPRTPEMVGNVICFTPGTRISTPEGPRRVEELCEGDRIQTRDHGAQDIQWIGARRITGARMFVMPELRPVRIGTGALGLDRPEQEMLVSPGHRMLVKGAAARSLFNSSEVLVAARDLVNGRTVTVDLNVREVTYIHLMLRNHEIIWANGVETESFHPASADLTTLRETDRMRLIAHFPELERDPHLYGGYARRSLTKSESAILRYEAA